MSILRGLPISFVLNNYQQLSIFDSLGFLSERKKRILDKSWAKPFSDIIFSNIDEMMFAPLYSEKHNSRPNAPVNVIVGALILKELNGLTDDEIIEECEFDFRYQYALHTTSYEDQPLSDRTFSRFRERNAAYAEVLRWHRRRKSPFYFSKKQKHRFIQFSRNK